MNKKLVLATLFVFMIGIALAVPLPPLAPSIDGSGTSALQTIDTFIQDEGTCDDTILNDDETDVDCGGNCDECEEGDDCDYNGDCITDYCDSNGVCRKLSCNDNVKNGNETGVDCGGSCSSCSNNNALILGANNIVIDQSGDSDQGSFSPPSGSSGNVDVSSNDLDAYGGMADEDIDISSEQTEKEEGIIIKFFSNKAGKYSLYVILGLIVCVPLLGLAVKKNKQDDTYINGLKSYVSTNLRKGYSQDQIRNILVQYHHNPQKIDEVFRSLK